MSEHGFGYVAPETPDPRNWPLSKLIAMVEAGVAQPVSWNDPVVLDQGQTPHCFPTGTLVRMADGSSRPIEDVRPTEWVMTAEGKSGQVLAVMARDYAGPLLHPRVRGHGHLSCTPDHLILTDRGYVAAGDLKRGDSVALTRSSVSWVRRCFDFSEVVADGEYRREESRYESHLGGVVTHIAAPPKTVELSAEFGRLLGLYAAEGHGHKYTSCFSFGQHERDTLVAETVDLLRSTLGIVGRVQHRPNNVDQVQVGGKHWMMFFDRLLGKGAGAKRLHPLITSGPDEFRLALLHGWLDGDGHKRRQREDGVTISHRLALDMFHIANDLGLRPVLRKSKTQHTNKKDRWDLEFAQNDSNPAGQSTLTDTATWRKFQCSQTSDYVGNVWNLEVEGDHSYVAEGIGVHNCVGFAGANFYATQEANAPADPTVSNQLGHDLYYECKVIDGQPKAENGSSIHTLMQVLKNRGAISAYAFAAHSSEVYDWLAKYGPAITGLSWYTGMEYPGPDRVMKLTGNIVGGHATIITAKDILVGNARYYKFRNQWGRSWGVNGDAYLSDENLDRLMHMMGEVAMAVKIVKTPTPPKPPTPPTPVPPSPDVKLPWSDWPAEYAAQGWALKNNAIVTGASDGKFHPDERMSQVQAEVVFRRLQTMRTTYGKPVTRLEFALAAASLLEK